MMNQLECMEGYTKVMFYESRQFNLFHVKTENLKDQRFRVWLANV